MSMIDNAPVIMACTLFVLLAILLGFIAGRCVYMKPKKPAEVVTTVKIPVKMFRTPSGQKLHATKRCTTLMKSRTIEEIEICKVCANIDSMGCS